MAKVKLPRWIQEAGTLLTGTAGAQLITVAAYFLLTRIYSPDDFGLFSIFCSYLEVLVIASTCKYELSIVAAADEREASAVSSFALKMNTAVSILLLVVAAILCATRSLPGKMSELGYIAMLIPPLVYFSGTSRVYENLFNRQRQYGKIALSEAVNAAATVAAKTCLGLAGLFSAGMPVGTVLGRMAGNINYRVALRRLQLPHTTFAEQRQAASRHRNFPLFVAPKDFANSLSFNLPAIWLANYFDLAEVGLFSLAVTFVFRPVNILNVTVEKVLYSRAVEHRLKGERMWPEVRQFLLPAVAIGLPVAVVLFFLADPLFGFLFGSQWAACGYYVRCLLPWILTMLLTNSLMYVSNVFSTQRAEFIFCLVLLALRAGAVMAGIVVGSFRTGILLFCVASTVVSAALLWWYLYQILRHDKNLKS